MFKLLFSILFLIGSFVYGGETASSTEDNMSFADLSLEDLLNLEVSVASGQQESINRAPSTVSVFTAEEIRRYGIRYLEELLDFVPGFQSLRTANITYHPVSRGRTTPSGAQVLYLIDGQRINADFLGGPGSSRLIPIENVKQVEIIRGPGSALYGSNAFMGVINIVTDKDVNRAEFAIENAKGRLGAIGYSDKIGGLSFSLFGRFHSSDGDNYSTDRLGGLEPLRDPNNGSDMYIYLGYKNVELSARHHDRHFKDFFVFNSSANGINSGDYSQSMLNLKYKALQSEQHQLDFSFQSIRSRNTRVFRVVPATVMGGLQQLGLTSSGDAFLGGPVQDELEISFRARYDLKINSKNRMSFGAVFRRPDVKKIAIQNNYDINDFISSIILQNFNPIRYYGDVVENNEFGQTGRRNIWGGFSQYVMTPKPWVQITAGLRYDDYEEQGNNISPRFAANIDFSPSTTVKLLYGEAFRTPTNSETSIVNSPQVRSNPDLDPETVTTWELAWQQRFSSFLTTLTYYNSKLEDGIVRAIDPNHPDPRPAPVNFSQIDFTGLELEIYGNFSKSIYVRLGGYYQFDTEEDPRIAADQGASILLGYTHKRMKFNVSGFYHSDVDLPESDTRIDAYQVINLNASYKIRENVEFKIEAFNLLDEEYYSPENATPLGLPYKGSYLAAELSFSF